MPINLLNHSNNLIEYSRRSKILEKEEEFYLIHNWRETRNKKSLEKILNAYLRLVVSYAKKYRNYGIPVEDLIHEGIIGIMHALNKFDLSKNFRLSTYASWWIRAVMQDYILKNWSIVRTGSTSSQKALFFNLKKIKKQISEASYNYMGDKETKSVAKILNVKPLEVQNMENRLIAGDQSLNQPVSEGSGNDLMSQLLDQEPSPEEITESINDGKIKQNWLQQSINTLTTREKMIISERKLSEKSSTLAELAIKLQISKERVRQIENIALLKLKKNILEISNQGKDFFLEF